MPEHNDAESRSHFSAWAVVSSPLTLGFDLTDEARMAAAWPTISNEEVIEVSQTWVPGAAFAAGRLVKQWQAANVPTLVVRGGCGKVGCEDEHPVNCSVWAKEKQCTLNPGYMRSHCRKSCNTCEDGNFTGWAFSGGPIDANGTSAGAGTLSLNGLCLDTAGQLPSGHGVTNHLHMLPCRGGGLGGGGGGGGGGRERGVGSAGSSGSRKSGPSPVATQLWRFDGGRIVSADTSSGQMCLGVSASWLWDGVPLVASTGNCGTGAGNLWDLHPSNSTLSNRQYGCVEISGNSGPPSTVWSKPLTKGRVALLAINGADLPQVVALDFAADISLRADADHHASSWSTRDVWAAKDLGVLPGLNATLAPHDCVLLVLSPKATASPTKAVSKQLNK